MPELTRRQALAAGAATIAAGLGPGSTGAEAQAVPGEKAVKVPMPGRPELDDTQELNWRTVCAAVVDTGFQGCLAHEFVPTRDPLTSLREAVVLCDV